MKKRKPRNITTQDVINAMDNIAKINDSFKRKPFVIGETIFWRWKERKYAYDKEVVVGVNGDLISMGKSKWSEARSWFDINELDIVTEVVDGK